MSEQVESIIEAVRSLDREQRLELTSALATIDSSGQSVAGNRKRIIDSIRGKYRHVPTSSEAFIKRKTEETSMEFPR
jgi:hypothetical protein